MKALAYKLTFVFVLIALVALFFKEGPSGKPFLTLEDFKPEPDVPDRSATKQGATVYRWQDEQGVWHFSNQPEDSAGAEIVEYDGNINTMAPLPAPSAPVHRPDTSTPSKPGVEPVGRIEAAMDTLNQAQQLQETIDQRKLDIDRALDRN